MVYGIGGDLTGEELCRMLGWDNGEKRRVLLLGNYGVKMGICNETLRFLFIFTTLSLIFIYSLLCNFEILWVKLYADEFAVKIFTSYSCCT